MKLLQYEIVTLLTNQDVREIVTSLNMPRDNFLRDFALSFDNKILNFDFKSV